MKSREATWDALVRAASAHASLNGKDTATALSTAAKDWAAANGYVKAVGGDAAPVATGTNSSGLVFPPYGHSKGKPVAGATEGDLRFYREGCVRSLANPEKARWHDKERAMLDAIDAELTRQGLPTGGAGTQEEAF